MPTVLFNADDFGLCRGVNHAIIDSHVNGVVASATMLVHAPGTMHAVELAKAHPTLQTGIHLALTIGSPVSDRVPSLIGENDSFRKLADQRNKALIDPEDVVREWTAQIERFLSFGLTPSHLDSHHHMHGWSHLRSAVETLSTAYGLPWRNAFEEEPNGVNYLTEAFDARFYRQGVNEEMLNQILNDHTNQQSVEIMCHPGYIDQFLTNVSSYTKERMDETEVLMNYRLPKEWHSIK